MTATTTGASRSANDDSNAIHARPAGFLNDTMAIAGRALRAVPKDLEAVLPPVFIAFFFFVVNIATFGGITEGTVRGLDYTAFSMPTAILLGVTGVSRAPAFVLDVQNGYLDRLLLTPIRRLSILIGHMLADVVVAAGLTVPILALGFVLGVRFEAGLAGVLVFIALGRIVEPRVRRVRLRHRAQDRQPRRSAVDVPAVLPVPVPHDLLRSPFAAVGLARHRGRVEPGHLPARRTALARHRRVGARPAGAGDRGDPPHRDAQHVDVLRRTSWPGAAGMIRRTSWTQSGLTADE